ncbi:MAG: DUF1801 domain-containing protein [Archangium sp.]|nr:DUF1801 domain-containing protein [Archangium sp.]
MAAVKGNEVLAYLAKVPPGVRGALQKLRKVIRSAAPEATEVISYQVPTFRHHGGLVAYGARGGHCSFFLMSPKIADAYAEELGEWLSGRATLRFSPGRPLPVALVKKLVKARVKENEALRKR